MTAPAAAGTDFAPKAQRTDIGHEIDPESELIPVVKGCALFDIQTQQVSFAINFVIAQHMLITHLNTRHQLPTTHANRGK
ncbi:hypothetical protein D3C80_2143640 [compost metagenome]